MAKVGRPLIEIDQRQFEAVLAIPFSTLERIAAVFNCSPDTLERWCKRVYNQNFADLKHQKTEGMKLKLAGKQYEVAMKGNIPMLIWLGKQDLGQSDKIEKKVEATVEDVTYKAQWGTNIETTVIDENDQP